jgi:hypothetical protein
MKEQQYLQFLDSTLDIYEWEEDAGDRTNDHNRDMEKVIEEANLEMTRTSWIRELVAIHGRGCCELLIANLVAMPFHSAGLHEILSDLLDNSEVKDIFDVEGVTGYWEHWWRMNKNEKKYLSCAWRNDSPRLSATFNAFMSDDNNDEVKNFINSQDAVVRQAVARNRNVSPENKVTLVQDKEVAVRLALARNPSTSPDLLARLSEDPHSIVRRWVACHVSTPDKILRKLAGDKDPGVRDFLKQHPRYK